MRNFLTILAIGATGLIVATLGLVSAQGALEQSRRYQAAAYSQTHSEHYVGKQGLNILTDEQNLLPAIAATDGWQVAIDQSQMRAFVRQTGGDYSHVSVTFSPQTTSQFDVFKPEVNHVFSYIPTTSSWDASKALFETLCKYAQIPPECFNMADDWLNDSVNNGLIVVITDPEGVIH